MLTVKPVYELLNVSDDLKWTTNTHVTPHFQGITKNIYDFWKTIFLPIHIRFTRPNDGWTGLYIKLWFQQSLLAALYKIFLKTGKSLG